MAKNSNNISKADSIINTINGTNSVKKYIKKENGLLERKENEEVILMEDNRRVLFG